MASERSRHIRALLTKDDPGLSLAEQRHLFEQAATEQALPSGMLQQADTIAGVETLRLDWTLGSDTPIILYAHGGGLTTGSVRTHRDLGQRLARACAVPVQMVGYRLLPEHEFPAPLNDVLVLYDELVGNQRISPSQIIFGGDSSGAALMLSALVSLRDSGQPMPAGLFAISGAFDASLTGEDLARRALDDPILSVAAIEDWQVQLAGSVALDDPRLSPLQADMSNLPPVLLLAGDDDLWCDDSRRLAVAIDDVGGVVDLRIFDEMWHVWPMSGDFPEADQALRAIGDFIINKA